MNGEKLTFFICNHRIVHFSGSYQGRAFEEREEEFYVGEIEDDLVIPGIQRAITRFGLKEKSK